MKTFFDSRALNIRKFTKFANVANLKCTQTFHVLQYVELCVEKLSVEKKTHNNLAVHTCVCPMVLQIPGPPGATGPMVSPFK